MAVHEEWRIGGHVPVWVESRAAQESWPAWAIGRREQELAELKVSVVHFTDMSENEQTIDLDSDAFTPLDESHAKPLDDALSRAIATLKVKGGQGR